MPIDLYWVNGPWPGKLAIMPRPRGDDWLEDDVRSWHYAGVDAVLSVLTSDEATELRLSGEEAYCRENGLPYCSFEIADRDVPKSTDAFAELLTRVTTHLNEGRNVAIHCRQGLGRAPLVAMGLLVSSGLEPDVAMRRVASARGCPVPETPEQRKWFEAFAESSMAHAPR